MPKIRYGQIGTSHAHAEKITAYRDSGEFEVVGVVEPDDQLRRRAEQSPAFRDLPWMTQEQLLNVPGLQVVGVETPVGDLLDTAEVCVDAGLHIHLDKPAGESLPQLRRIMESAASKHLLVQLGYMYRYNPAVVLLREFLRKGWLGEPFEVHTVMSKVVAPESRRRFATFRGGMMFELGCHVLDLTVGVLGKPQDVVTFRRQATDNSDGLSDNMLAVLTYPHAIASVKSTALEVEGFARRHFVVCGSEGTFHIQPLDDPAARVALSRQRDSYDSGYQELTFPKYVRYVDDAADMARIIRGEKDADFSYQHDLIVQETLLRACDLPIEG